MKFEVFDQQFSKLNISKHEMSYLQIMMSTYTRDEKKLESPNLKSQKVKSDITYTRPYDKVLHIIDISNI